MTAPSDTTRQPAPGAAAAGPLPEHAPAEASDFAFGELSPADFSRPPPKRGAGIKVADVAALVDKLKNEAKVI